MKITQYIHAAALLAALTLAPHLSPAVLLERQSETEKRQGSATTKGAGEETYIWISPIRAGHIVTYEKGKSVRERLLTNDTADIIRHLALHEKQPGSGKWKDYSGRAVVPTSFGNLQYGERLILRMQGYSRNSKKIIAALIERNAVTEKSPHGYSVTFDFHPPYPLLKEAK